MRYKNKDIVKGYTTLGKEIANVEDANCFAKEIYDRETKSNLYYVKVGTNGSYHAGMPLNPYDIEYKRSAFGWKRVNLKRFEIYLGFLRTQNTSRLLQMDREQNTYES